MTAPAHKQTIVGRSAEIASLDTAISDLRQGHGAVVLISGEPGIGKSTLARHAAAHARALDIEEHWGFAWEAGGAPAFWPWTQLLRSLLNTHPELSTPQLQRLIPEAAHDEDQEALTPDQAQFQLLESVREFLVAASRDNPMLLFLEDLHAADADSLHLLQYVAQHAEALPILLIGTFRELEARTRTSMESLWRTARVAHVIRPGQLDEDDISEFLTKRKGESPDTDQVQLLKRTTAGNPLFMSELVDLLEVGGDAAGQLPDSIHQVISQQIDLLPAPTTDQLQRASVLGREFSIAALAEIQSQDAANVESELAAATDASFIRKTRTGWYQFAHALHRDVLYQSLELVDRQAMHLKLAQRMCTQIDGGDVDRWTTCAAHLEQAGEEHRDAAIDAWRNSGRRALARLAFEDAAISCKRALTAFGDGPRYDPAERCDLLLECAQAMMLSGDIDGGRGLCREAFAIARTLEDTRLMTDAVMAWGSAFVVASVDAEMIEGLQQCLAALPDEDVKRRSMVQARLAAAMQPALDASVPMAMARDALEMARSIDDVENLYSVLRSAIGALMDFAPAQERYELNCEFLDLARKFGDVAGQYRSNLRMMIDAAEMGDRQRMYESVSGCEDLAKRIGLPHYRWRAASAKAMVASIEGRFADASALIEEAENWASRIDDLEAKVTLPLQRFLLLCRWDSTEVTPLDEIRAQLRAAYADGMGNAEFFVEPFLASWTESKNNELAKSLIANAAIVERTFKGGDRFSLTCLGEIASLAGDLATAERAYDRVKEFDSVCVTTGLMGSCWAGPVAASLGIIANALGRPAAAMEHLEKAWGIAEQMSAAPTMAYIDWLRADIAEASGDAKAARIYRDRSEQAAERLQLRRSGRAPAVLSASQSVPTSGFEMARDGDIWHISFAGNSAMLKDSKGLGMLSKLIDAPEQEIHAIDLTGATGATDTGDAGAHLDAKAREEYRQRVVELKESIEEAEEFGDIGRKDSLRAELEFIEQELSRAFGIGGRQRKAGSAAERARVNARRRISDAIARITEAHPKAGKYLKNSIKTGTYCKYSPA